MVDVKISEDRFADMCFVVNGAAEDDEIYYYCMDPDHAYWLKEHGGPITTRQEYGPKRWYVTFDNMTTALLYKLTWGNS